jgi:hypothetical protein
MLGEGQLIAVVVQQPELAQAVLHRLDWINDAGATPAPPRSSPLRALAHAGERDARLGNHAFWFRV